MNKPYEEFERIAKAIMDGEHHYLVKVNRHYSFIYKLPLKQEQGTVRQNETYARQKSLQIVGELKELVNAFDVSNRNNVISKEAAPELLKLLSFIPRLKPYFDKNLTGVQPVFNFRYNLGFTLFPFEGLSSAHIKEVCRYLPIAYNRVYYDKFRHINSPAKLEKFIIDNTLIYE